jgi:hypothetical protein
MKTNDPNILKMRLKIPLNVTRKYDMNEKEVIKRINSYNADNIIVFVNKEQYNDDEPKISCHFGNLVLLGYIPKSWLKKIKDK